MSTGLIPFDGHNVRILNENGTPWDGYEEAWFIPREIAQAIGASEPKNYATKILSRNPDKFKGFVRGCQIVTPQGGKQTANIINENGLYMFLMASDLPKAIGFQRQVTEILKSIRKTGKYSTQPEYQNESLRAAMEIFRSLDINNMKATDRAAFFRMVGRSFAAGKSQKKDATIDANADRITEDAQNALNWVRKMYAKYGNNEPIFGIPNGDWFLVRRSRWRQWAEQNQLNLTTILKELHRQGIVKKFYNGNPRYSRIQRVEGVAVHLVWVKREFIESDGPHLSVVKS